MSTVEDLQGYGTREFHTSQSLEAAEYVFDRMEAIGLSTVLQEFPVDDVESVNVIGTLNADKRDEGTFIIGAHYDSENMLATNQSQAENYTAPGADDNASGVGAMLEIARILSAEEVFAAPVTFVAFGAEERGYDATGGAAGSAFFANESHNENASIMGAFVMDMIGYSRFGQNVTTVVSDGDSDLLYHSLVNASAKYGIDLSIEFVMNPLLRYSDHRSFWDLGYQSVLLIEEIDSESYYPANPYYHSSYDLAEVLSEEQMTAVSKTLLGALLDLTNEVLTDTVGDPVGVGEPMSPEDRVVGPWTTLAREAAEQDRLSLGGESPVAVVDLARNHLARRSGVSGELRPFTSSPACSAATRAARP